MKERVTDFTQGGILGPLMRFMLPVLFAMLLQDLYGAVDLFIVGRFALRAARIEPEPFFQVRFFPILPHLP